MKFQRIQDLRTDADMSQKQLSEILHISQRSYSHYETGSRNIPVEMLIRLANYYDISVDFDPAYQDVKPCWTVLIALFYGVVITKPDKSPVETVKSNDQLKGMRRT